MQNQLLFDQILAFDIDGGPSQITFAHRLARENGWSLSFTKRVIREYKRFVYLTMTTGHPCSPSEAVDEAWHLHLCYTHSYWTRLVGEVLPRPLHHNPTKGGRAEDTKHVDLYRRTLETYEREFGEAPPADIWPTPGRRVAPVDHWVVSKAKVRLLAGLGGVAVATAIFLAGCMPLFSQVDEGGSGTVVLFVVLGLAAIVGLIAFIVWLARRSTGSAGCSDDSVVVIDEGGGCSAPGCSATGCSGGVPVDPGASGHDAGHAADSGGHAGDAGSPSGDSSSGSDSGSSTDGGSGGGCSSGSCSGGGCSS